MEYQDRIIKYLKENHGIVTTAWCESQSIPRAYLSKMEKEGLITRIARGIYIDESGDYDEYYFFQLANSKCIYSYVSALYLQRKTDIIPQNLEVTVYKGYNVHRIPDEVMVHYVSKDIYELGKIEVNTIFGNPVYAYNLERTVCDLIKNRKKVESELFSKTIQVYIKSRDKNMNTLFKYAEKMGITDKVQEIMEVCFE